MAVAATVLMMGGGGIGVAAQPAEPADPVAAVSWHDDSRVVEPRVEKILKHDETMTAHIAYKAGEKQICDYLKKKFGSLAKAICKKLYEAASVLRNPPEKKECLRGSSTRNDPYVKFEYVSCK